MVHERYKAKKAAKELLQEEVDEGGLFATALYFIVLGLVLSFGLSKMVTGTWLWNQSESKWLQKRTWIPVCA